MFSGPFKDITNLHKRTYTYHKLIIRDIPIVEHCKYSLKMR